MGRLGFVRILVLVEGRYEEKVEGVHGVMIRQEAVRHCRIPFPINSHRSDIILPYIIAAMADLRTEDEAFDKKAITGDYGR